MNHQRRMLIVCTVHRFDRSLAQIGFSRLSFSSRFAIYITKQKNTKKNLKEKTSEKNLVSSRVLCFPYSLHCFYCFSFRFVCPLSWPLHVTKKENLEKSRKEKTQEKKFSSCVLVLVLVLTLFLTRSCYRSCPRSHSAFVSFADRQKKTSKTVEKKKHQKKMISFVLVPQLCFTACFSCCFLICIRCSVFVPLHTTKRKNLKKS
jgi:hypothetical protein